MRIGFFVNDLATEKAAYTTTCLALEAVRMGHEIWYIGAGDFAYDPDEMIHARARSNPRKQYESNEAFLDDLRGDKARSERITVDELDVLLLRSDPSVELIERPWADIIGIVFGRLAMHRGVIVLNDPRGLANAMNKLYFQQFPAEVRPITLITRDRGDIKQFVKSVGNQAVIKPLQGSGGQNVFLVRKEDAPNLNQMIDAVSRDGYVIVQEFLPAAKKGDTRLFLMNGVPLEHNGKYAAFSRLRSGGDLRSNMHAGGKAAKTTIDEAALRIAEMVRPKLVRDGMFLVGLDIAGDKLLEINVFSPGGLHSASKLNRVNFMQLVIEALERKVQYARFDKPSFDNAELATL